MKWTGINRCKMNVPLNDYLRDIFDNEIRKGYELKVCVGTDSQKSGKGYKFATAIVIETREFMGVDPRTKKNTYSGRGSLIVAATYWEEMKASTNRKKHREIEVLNHRMLKEVSTSINVGWEISELLDEYNIPMEIHADINENPRYPSNTAISEAIAYINGQGWDSKVKPDAYASSKAADRICK